MATAVIVIDRRGERLREYKTITQAANEYGTTDRTIREHIEKGTLFPRGNVFFDYALNGGKED